MRNFQMQAIFFLQLFPFKQSFFKIMLLQTIFISTFVSWICEFATAFNNA